VKVDALRQVAMIAKQGGMPTSALQDEAMIEAIELAVSFFLDVHRMADAMERLSLPIMTLDTRDPHEV
jgi:uncharacterized membrane protein